MPQHSSTLAQPSYYYAAPAHPQLPGISMTRLPSFGLIVTRSNLEYGTENESSMSQEFQVNFANRNPPPQGPISPYTSINVPPPGRHHYSLQPPQISSTRQYKDRISTTLSEHGPQGQVPRPSNRRDEYLQHGFTSHPAAERYSNNPSTNIPSLTPDYMNHPAPSVTSHAYPTT